MTAGRKSGSGLLVMFTRTVAPRAIVATHSIAVSVSVCRSEGLILSRVETGQMIRERKGTA